MADPFFESDIVAHCLEDIVALQTEVLVFSEYGLFASLEDQKANLKTLRTLLAKQKNMFFRCMLSNEPSAKQLAKDIIEHFSTMGFDIPENPMEIFEEMSISIDQIEQDLNEYEEYQ
jgi:hypothetical protein